MVCVSIRPETSEAWNLTLVPELLRHIRIKIYLCILEPPTFLKSPLQSWRLSG